MSGRTIPQAPAPHQAPPLATATRRHLFGTMGAALLLTAAEAGAAKAAELDGELLAACVAFQRINQDYVAANHDPNLTDQRSEHLYEERRALALCISEWAAKTPERLLAKARAARAALHADVPEHLTDTFQDCADYHDLLADSTEPEEEAAQEERALLQHAQEPLAHLMVKIRALTVEGQQARARSLALWEGDNFSGDANSDYVNVRLLGAVLRDLTEGSAGT